MIKRIFLFVITNLFIVLTISIVLNILGVKPYLTSQGLDYESLLIFCFVWGMGGAFISLALSRIMAKMMMGVKVIDPQRPGAQVRLLNMISRLAQSAGLPNTPEVGIYNSPTPNAFATGPTKSRALVAFSTGLLESMTDDEIEGVAAHEIAHIANGDMVTMTLLQGIINAFVMFLARVIAFAISQGRGNSDDRPAMNYFVVILLEIVLSLLGMVVLNWFSRQREFRADAGSARYAGRGKMIAALQKLDRMSGRPHIGEPASIQTLKISGGEKSKGLGYYFFASHPPISERIRNLEQGI